MNERKRLAAMFLAGLMIFSNAAPFAYAEDIVLPEEDELYEEIIDYAAEEDVSGFADEDDIYESASAFAEEPDDTVPDDEPVAEGDELAMEDDAFFDEALSEVDAEEPSAEFAFEEAEDAFAEVSDEIIADEAVQELADDNEEITFTVTWDANGGYFLKDEWDDYESEWVTKEVGQKTDEYKEGFDISYYDTPDTHVEGVEFAGWALDPNASETIELFSWDDEGTAVYNYKADQDYTFYAVWKTVYTITWDANGGYYESEKWDEDEGAYVKNEVGQVTNTLLEGEGISEQGAPYTHVEGVIFTGWALNADADEPVDFVNENDEEIFKADQDYTFYAVWKPSRAIIWDANGGYFETGEWDEEAGSYVTKEVGQITDLCQEGKGISDYGMPYTHTEGVEFAGWALDPNASEPIEFYDWDDEDNLIYNYKADTNYTFYAIWKTAYTITWDANGGYLYEWDGADNKIKVTEKTEKMTEGSKIDGYPIPEIDENKAFVGWADRADADATEVIEFWDDDDVPVYTVGQDYTFYAIWENSHTITLDANGGYFILDDETQGDIGTRVSQWVKKCPVGSDVEPWDTPNTDGDLVFAGWAFSADADKKVDIYDEKGEAVFKANEDYTFYAIWKPGHTITWDANGGYFEEEEWDGEKDEWIVVGTVSSETETTVDGDDILYHYEPMNDNRDVYFAGWARTPNATVGDRFWNNDGSAAFQADQDYTFYAVWASRIASHSEGIASPSEGTASPSEGQPTNTNPTNTNPGKPNPGNTKPANTTPTNTKPSGTTPSKTIPEHAHSYGAWKVTKAPTAVAEGVETRTCSCGKSETRAVKKLTATMSLFITGTDKSPGTLPMKVKQNAKNVVTVSDLALGDSVASVKSANVKIVKPSISKNKISLKAGTKTGTAKVTVTLASGLSKAFKVKVQKKTVKTTKVSVAAKKITLKKGKKYNLSAFITPITSQQKISYKSSDAKVAKVSKKGVVKAKKTGKAKITVKSGKKKVVVTVIVK